jgi:hypothetical protein
LNFVVLDFICKDQFFLDENLFTSAKWEGYEEIHIALGPLVQLYYRIRDGGIRLLGLSTDLTTSRPINIYDIPPFGTSKLTATNKPSTNIA